MKLTKIDVAVSVAAGLLVMVAGFRTLETQNTLVPALTYIPAPTYNSDVRPAISSDNKIFAACVIHFNHPDRKTPTLTGGSHVCTGVKSVGIRSDTGDLQLKLEVTDAKTWKVVMPDFEPDESLTRQGITAGVSGGTNQLTVMMYDKNQRKLDLRTQADRDLIWGKYSNGWYHSEWVNVADLPNHK